MISFDLHRLLLLFILLCRFLFLFLFRIIIQSSSHHISIHLINSFSLFFFSNYNHSCTIHTLTSLLNSGIFAFWRGVIPFAQRAVVVGVCQVGTFDVGKEFYEEKFHIQRGTTLNVFCAAMTSGLFYALVTMPLESAKNRMASQKAGSGELLYKSTMDTITKVAKKEGVVALWNGFLPYYLRCGGHTTSMFIFVEWLRRSLM